MQFKSKLFHCYTFYLTYPSLYLSFYFLSRDPALAPATPTFRAQRKNVSIYCEYNGISPKRTSLVQNIFFRLIEMSALLCVRLIEIRLYNCILLKLSRISQILSKFAKINPKQFFIFAIRESKSRKKVFYFNHSRKFLSKELKI